MTCLRIVTDRGPRTSSKSLPTNKKVTWLIFRRMLRKLDTSSGEHYISSYLIIIGHICSRLFRGDVTITI